ncbi:MAG TPA: agmatine deiminase family protein [Haliangium sp.]|nr:agmatine deiminase family protein [Haliangium sp.]
MSVHHATRRPHEPATTAWRWPAEWEPHAACWLAWPAHPEEWLGDVDAPRRSVAAMAAAIADVDPATGQARGERIDMLVLDDEGEASARAALAGVPATLHRVPYGDIWLRDTGPIFVHAAGAERGAHGDRPAQRTVAACFGWNGWGGKYDFPDDHQVAERIAERTGAPARRFDFVLEGGALDGDGQGTALTTRQCVLNPNRNPAPDQALDQATIEARLTEALGIARLIWLDRGLLNDHTDGHVDNIARFVGPGTVVCMRAHDRNDPHREILDEIARDLRAARDAAGRPLDVVEIPAPGLVRDARGDIVPASYMNFYLGNSAVVVPVYGTPYDHAAVDALAAVFPGRRVVGVDAHAVLVGGGAFHCISREQPASPQAAPGPGSGPAKEQP